MNRLMKIITEEVSTINRDEKKEIFDYSSLKNDAWNDSKKNAQKFQRINFDFENDDSTGQKKTFFIKKNLRKDQPIKYEINVELMEAGGDWEMPVMYFRIEFTRQYGILNNKYGENPEYVWDVLNKEGYLSTGKRFIIIPPAEAGNKLVKGESDSGKYDWFAYQNDELSKEDEKSARITKEDKISMWKWLSDLIEKLIDDRHEMLDEPDDVKITDDREDVLDVKTKTNETYKFNKMNKHIKLINETKTDNELSVRDMLKITRHFVNEDVENNISLDNSEKSGNESDNVNKKTILDQEMEEEKFRNFFDDLNVHIDLDDIIIKGNGVFWTGVIDGVIRFVYRITDNDETSGVVLNYLRDGYENNETTMEIVDRIKSYYDTFYKYWNRNLPSN